MRNRVLILVTAVMALLGLLVPTSAVGASSSDEVKAATTEIVDQVEAATEAARSQLPAEGQALLDEVLAQVSAAADTVQSAHLWSWADHPELKAALDALIAWGSANLSALLPIVRDLLLALLPAIPFLIGPIGDLLGIVLDQIATVAPILVDLLCEAGVEFLPAFAGIIGSVCGFIEAILPAVIDLIPIILPILATLIPPLVGIVCDLAASFLPSFATIITAVCGVLDAIFNPPTTTTTAP